MQNLGKLNWFGLMGKRAVALLVALGVSVAAAGPLDTLQPGQWYQAPNSNLSAHDPCPARPCTYSGVEGHPAVMDSWSGGAYDTKRDRLIVWGGGHNAYAGNELYVFDIATLAWSRVTEPSTTILQDALYYPDGKPSARHTYNMLVYVPDPVDRFIAVGAGSTYGETGGSGSSVDAFNFATNTWSRHASIPSAAGYASMYGSIAAYDAGNGHVWFHDTLTGTLREYDPVADTWQVRVSNYLEDYSTAAIDPVRRLMVTVGGKSGILIWDLNNPTSAPFKPASTSGDAAIQSAQAPGFVYDSASKLLVGWDGGSAVYTLNPPLNPKTGTWVWTKVNPAGSNTVTPTASEARGTYGRFQYVPSKNVFVAVNRTTEDVYFYRLSNSGAATAPTVTFSSSSSSVSFNGSTTLTWSSTDTTSCTASGGWNGTKATSGSAVIESITADASFTLSCSGAGGSASKNVAVTVTGAPPTVSLSASLTSVTSGGSSTLTWSSTNATSCTASGAWTGAKTTAGSQQLTSLTTSGTYTLTCTGTGGSVSQSSVINVTTGSLPPGITTLKVTNQTTSAQTNVPVTLGHYFKFGDVPSTMNLLAKRSDGTPVTVQVDKKATHSDGSLKHAVLTLQLADLAVGSELLTLYTDPTVPAGAAVSLPNLRATLFDAQVSLQKVYDYKTVNNITRSGTRATATVVGHGLSTGQTITIRYADQPEYNGIFTVTVVDANTLTYNITGTPASPATGPISILFGEGKTFTASAKTLLTTAPAITWLSGSEVSEWIVSGPLKDSLGNAHPHLTAYFHVRAYAGFTRVRVDAVVENNWTFKNNANGFNYVPTVTVGGTTIYDNSGASLNHAHHSRWHQVGWWGSAPQVYVQPDTQYLRASKAVPNYANITLQNSVLSSYVQTIVPMSNANLRVNWGDTGYSTQIGILPEWDASFIISGGDVRAYNGTLANSSAGGSYSYHYRDEGTGYPVSLDTYPNLNEQDYGGGLVEGAGGNAYSHEPGADPAAHQPMLGYLAYLLSGDYFYLEEMQFLANYNMIWNSISRRTYLAGPQDGIVGYQNRGQAWGIRTLGFAAALTPDLHPLKNYLVTKTNNNIAEKTANWAAPAQNSLGAIQDFDWISGYSVPPKYSPWQNDFFVMVFNRLVDLGFSNAAPMRDWLNQWPVGRLGGNSGTSGFCWKYATQYGFNAGIVDGAGAYVTSFTQLYQRNFPTESASACPTSGLMQTPASPTMPDAYYSNLQAALAMAVDAGAATQSLWTKFLTMGTPDYTAAPVWAIVPRPVSGTPAPTVVLSASPGSVALNGSATLVWSATSAASCTASGSWSGTKTTSGTEVISNITASSTFTINCSGVGGSASQSVTVAVVVPAPTVTFNASPTSVISGASSTLTWSSTNATTCTASSAATGWSGVKATAGSTTLTNRTSTGTYTLTCTGAGGSASQNATISVTSPAPTVTISASPASVAYNGSSTLTWSSTNATACTASGAWNVPTATSGSQVLNLLTATSNYTLTCSGAGGSVNQTVTITVAPPPPVPTVTLSASSLSVAYNGSSTLTWSSTDATACSASGGWSGNKTMAGTQLFSPLTSTATYTLSCSNVSGSASKVVTVTVGPAPVSMPTVTLSASPTIVSNGGSTTLTWSSTNATTCTATVDWSGSKAVPSGTQVLSNLTANKSYTLTCTGTGGSASQMVAVVVLAAVPPTVTINANPSSVVSNGSSTVSWSSTNANTCIASNGWSGAKEISGSQTFTNLLSTTTFTLICTGTGGSTTSSTTVAVGLPPPTLTLSADSASIAYGGTSNLTWLSTNATTCTASGAWSGVKAASGSEVRSGLTMTSDYTLTCVGSGGAVSQSTKVTVAEPIAPEVTLTSDATVIAPQGTVTLTWAATNATACEASGQWSGSKATSGIQSIGPLFVNSTFTLTCNGPGSPVTKTVIITIDGNEEGISPGKSDINAPPEAATKVGGGSLNVWMAIGMFMMLLARQRHSAIGVARRN